MAETVPHEEQCGLVIYEDENGALTEASAAAIKALEADGWAVIASGEFKATPCGRRALWTGWVRWK